MTPTAFYDKLSLLVEMSAYPYGTAFAIGHGPDLHDPDSIAFWRCAAHLPPTDMQDGVDLEPYLSRGLWVRPIDRDLEEFRCVICQALGQ